MTPTQTIQQADGHDQRILAEHELAGRRVVLESLDATDPALPISVPIPAAPYGYRVATIADIPALSDLKAGTRVSLFDPAIKRLAYGVVRSWSEGGVNVALLGSDVRLATVDQDRDPLGASFPLTDGHYWLLTEAGR